MSDYVLAKLKGQIVGAPMTSGGAVRIDVVERVAKEKPYGPKPMKNGDVQKSRKVYENIIAKDAVKAYKDFTGVDADEFIFATEDEVNELVYKPQEEVYLKAVAELEAA